MRKSTTTRVMTVIGSTKLIIAAENAPVVQVLLRSPGIKLMSFAQADAYQRRFPFLGKLVLPHGVADQEFELARLAAAGGQPGAVVTLDVQTVGAQSARQALHGLQRRGPVSELDAREVLQVHRGSGWRSAGMALRRRR